MNLIIIALSALSVLGLWTSVLLPKKWITMLTLCSITSLLVYLPYYLMVLTHNMYYNFGTVFQALKYLLDNQGIGN